MSKEEKIAKVMELLEKLGVIPQEEPQDIQSADQADFPKDD